MTITRLTQIFCILLVITFMGGCLDHSDPEWWDGKRDAVILADGATVIESGLTIRLTGQNCEECAGSTCWDWETPPEDSLRLHFIDVGQGGSIWVQTPDGRNILIDAGDGGFFGNRTQGGEVVIEYLKAHDMPIGSTFDAIVVSHAHADHYGGFSKILGPYRIESFVDPGLPADSSSYKSLVTQIEGLLPSSAIYRPVIGDDGLVNEKGDEATGLFGDQIESWVLSAEASMHHGDDTGSKINNTSIIFRLGYAGRHILLMADGEQELEAEMVQRFAANTEEPRLTSDLLKVGHHGSSTSSTPSFLNAVWNGVGVTDRRAVIMSGRLSFSGTQLPRDETVQRIQLQIGAERLFSTEAGDGAKTEETAAGDDDVLAVVRKDGSFFVCYSKAIGD